MVVAFALYATFLYVVFFALGMRKRPPYLYLFLIKVVLVGLLFVLPDKLAVVEINEVRAAGFRHNFLFYYLVGLPLVEVVNMPRAAMAAVSTVTSAIISVLIVQRLPTPHPKAKLTVLSLLFFFPDVVYFTAFSLRDIGIAFFCLFIVFDFYAALFWKIRPRWIHIAVISVILISLRPEMMIWIAAIVALFFTAKALAPPTIFLATFLAAGFSLFLFDVAAPSLLKFVGLVNPEIQISGIEAWRVVLSARYYRQFSDSDGSGTTSALFDPFFFETATNFEIFAVQITSFLTLGLSTLTITKILGILTGALLYVIVTLKLRVIFKSKAAAFALIAGFLCFLIFAPFAVNGGNVFRMRLPLVVILIFVFATCSRWVLRSNATSPRNDAIHES